MEQVTITLIVTASLRAVLVPAVGQGQATSGGGWLPVLALAAVGVG
jgi:hypothetical protein